MLSLRMGSGAEMVLWYIMPRKFSFLPSKRHMTRYFSSLYQTPSVKPKYSHHHVPKQHSVTHFARRHNNTNAGDGQKSATNTSRSSGWPGWQYWFAIWKPLPLGVGLAVLAILQWRRIYRRSSEGQVTCPAEPAKDWEITCYRAVPLRTISRAWGWLTETQLPVALRPWLYSRYANTFGCNLDEAASKDLTSYKSLSDFFVRELRDGVRPIHPCVVVSPADGRILSVGKVLHKVEQVKGVNYSLKTFLGEQTWLEQQSELSDYFKPQDSIKAPEVMPGGAEDYQECLLEKNNTCLYQCVIYLAPGDYHRFHSPVQWKVNFRRHFQGELLSVNPKIVKWIPNLFTLNERAVYVGNWQHGFFSLTAVGATNVGSIKVYCDQSLITNERKWRHDKSRHRDLFLRDADNRPIDIKKGQSFGEFRLGSTVVLVFEAPKDFTFGVQPGQKIRVGESLCKNLEAFK